MTNIVLQLKYDEVMCMKNKKHSVKNRYIALLISIFVIFMIGFISAILLLLRKSNIMTTSLLESPIAGSHVLNFWGINVMNFDVVELKNGGFDITINKSIYYNILPFIAGGVLVTISLIISSITKRLLTTNEEKDDLNGNV